MRSLTLAVLLGACVAMTSCASTPHAPPPAGGIRIMDPGQVVTATTAPSAAVVGRAKPALSTPDVCAGNTTAQRVLVSIHLQRAWMCSRGHSVFATAITSGAVDLPYQSTPLGRYQIQGRTRDTTLTLSTGAAYAVKYWIPFDAPLFGFHDSSWQDFPFGSQKYRTAGSHGCIHLPLKAMKFLYDWSARDTSVTIRA